MKNIDFIRKFMLLSIVILGATSCGPKFLSKEDAYPKMYREKPLSILVLPPINLTTAADVKEFYSVTVAEPLSLAGYYVYPIEVVSDILKNEGMYDTELMEKIPPQKFKELFNADAVMFIKIKQWDTSYYVIGGSVTVGLDIILKSTSTGEGIWNYDGVLKVDTTGEVRTGGLLGIVLQMAETAVKTATTDYVPIARQVNYITMNTMPVGKYHPEHGKDGGMRIVDENKVIGKKE